MREKKLREVEQIAQTIRLIAAPGMKPKALIDAVKAHHPDASRKEIARAAFLSDILSVEYAAEDAQTLHDIATDAAKDDDD